MSISRRTFSKFVGVTASGGILAGAYRPVFAQDDRRVLRLALSASDYATLDPHFASASQDRSILDMVFSGLVRFTPGDTSAFEPDLAAEMPTATENGDGTQTWSIPLREGVMWHGTTDVEAHELTPDDVLFSYQKAASPETSAYASDYIDWQFEVDGTTFLITLPEPMSETLFMPRIANYSGGFVMSRQAYETLGSDGVVSQPVGTGPFAFVSHTPQNNVTLMANDDYFRGAPQLGGVEVRFVADTTSRELALQAGDVHVVTGLRDTVWVERMDAIDGIAAEVFGVGEVIFVSLDTQHEILSDARVREAIMLAISRENHLALAGPLLGEVLYSIVPEPLMPGGLTREEAEAAGIALEPDLDRARQLLAEAGYPDGFELDLISGEQLTYLHNYEVLAEELRQIGIEVSLEVVQTAAMHQLIREGRNAIVVYVAYRPTADTYLSQFFSTEGEGANFSNFTVDDLRDQARAETDPEVQTELWKQANIEIAHNFAGLGLMTSNQAFARLDSIDFGHELISIAALYPGIDETTSVATE